MDASPLAQLNNRQQPFVISPIEIENVSPLWEPSQQRMAMRPNPLQRGAFARSNNSSFGSFSSSSSSSSYTNATSASNSGTGYFDLKARSRCDLLSPMASLTADMSANFSLDPTYIPFPSNLIVEQAQDYLRLGALSCHHYHSAPNSEVDNRCGQLPLTTIQHLASTLIPRPIRHSPTKYLLHSRLLSLPPPHYKISPTV